MSCPVPADLRRRRSCEAKRSEADAGTKTGEIHRCVRHLHPENGTVNLGKIEIRRTSSARGASRRGTRQESRDDGRCRWTDIGDLIFLGSGDVRQGQ